MMKASELTKFHPRFTKNDWPKGVLNFLDADVLTKAVFPLRDLSNVPMWPSSLFDAHIRHEGNSMHSTKGKTRYALATDMHVSTIANMLKAMYSAEQIPEIGGIGIYFDTNTPLIHVDLRPQRLVWVRTSEGEYVYRENDPKVFYQTLAQELEKANG